VLIRFDDSLETGHADIDGHHRGLIDWCNDLNDPDSALVRAGKADEGMRFLARFVDFHFAAEERAMAGSGYPRQAAHEKAHAWFRAEVRALERQLGPRADTRALAVRLRFLMQDWFLQHVRLDDRQLAAWLREHPVQATAAEPEDSLAAFVARSGIDLGALQDVRIARMKPKAKKRPGDG